MTRKIMSEFILDEISLVDEPAQVPATSDISKSAEKKKEIDTMNDTKIVELEAKLAKAMAVAAMSDETKKFYNALATDAERDAFLSLDDKGRDAAIAKAKDKDPIVYEAADGSKFRASDDPRLVKMAKDRDVDRAALKASQELADEARVDAIAKDFTHLPGEAKVHKTLAKAVDGIADASERKAALALLKSLADNNDDAFRKFSIADSADALSKQANATDELDKLTKEYALAHKLSEASAMTAVLKTARGAALYKQIVGE